MRPNLLANLEKYAKPNSSDIYHIQVEDEKFAAKVELISCVVPDDRNHNIATFYGIQDRVSHFQ